MITLIHPVEPYFGANVFNTLFQQENPKPFQIFPLAYSCTCVGIRLAGTRMGLQSPGPSVPLCKTAPLMMYHFSGSAYVWAL